MWNLPEFAKEKEKKEEKKDMDFSTLTDGKALRAIRALVLAKLVTVPPFLSEPTSGVESNGNTIWRKHAKNHCF